MPKKVRVLVSVLVALALLAAGGVATVMAQDESIPEEPALSSEATNNGLLARVAEILGVPQEDLASAFKQARQEMTEEASLRALDKAVEKGLITEEEADQIKEWWQQRPEVLDASPPQRFFGAPALRGGHTGGGYKFMAPWGRHMRGGPRGWHSDNATQTG